MAVSRVEQREIVEIPFVMPGGIVLPHPALVISRGELQEDEDGMFYAVLISSKNHFPEYTIPIQNEWLNKPMGKQSYFITHLVNMFTVEDVMNRNNRFIKKEYFDKVIDRIIDNIIG